MAPSNQNHTSEPIIRVMSLDDTVAARKMHADSWNITYPNEQDGITSEWVHERTAQWLTPEGIEKSRQYFSDILHDHNHYHRIAVIGDKVVGAIHVSKVDGKQCLQMIYVEKSQYGTGLSQRLINGAFIWLDKTKSTTLEVVYNNQRAIAFYGRNGFEIDEGSEHLYADKLTVINMTRKGDKK
jgi:ribosomal protein S18 acetylase RimI-like enzyme